MKSPRPPRVLFATAGSHGDIHPFIALALALKARGAATVLTTNPYFQAEIERAGIDFFPASKPIDVAQFIRDNPWMHNPLVAGKRLFERVVLPMLEDGQRRADDLIRDFKPDIALMHPLCVGGAAVSEKHHVPWASVALAPVIWMSAHEPNVTVPIGPGGMHPPLWWWRFLRHHGRKIMRRVLDRPLNRNRAALGLAPLEDHWDNVTRGGVLSLGLWSPAFRPPLPDDPAAARITGFPWYDQSEQDWPGRDALERFIAADAPPIVFSLGTATVHDPRNFYDLAAHAAHRIGRRAVLLIGRSGTPPRNLPPGVICAAYAPFSWIMPRCAAAVHHGGIGSTAQGLRSGRPTVIVPFSHDQFDNARRCEVLGTSVTLKASRMTRARFERALSEALDAPRARAAQALAPNVAHDGADAAAQEIIASVTAR